MEKVVNFELKFRKDDIFPAELIFDLDKFVLELNPQLTLIVEIMFQFIFSFFEFFPFIFQHKLEFCKVMIISWICIYYLLLL